MVWEFYLNKTVTKIKYRSREKNWHFPLKKKVFSVISYL